MYSIWSIASCDVLSRSAIFSFSMCCQWNANKRRRFFIDKDIVRYCSTKAMYSLIWITNKQSSINTLQLSETHTTSEKYKESAHTRTQRNIKRRIYRLMYVHGHHVFHIPRHTYRSDYSFPCALSVIWFIIMFLRFIKNLGFTWVERINIVKVPMWRQHHSGCRDGGSNGIIWTFVWNSSINVFYKRKE